MVTRDQRRREKRRDRRHSFKEAEQELFAIDAELDAFVKMEMEDWGLSTHGNPSSFDTIDVVGHFANGYVESEASYLVHLARAHAKRSGMFKRDFLSLLNEVVHQASDRPASLPDHIPIPVQRFLQDFVVPTAQSMGEDGKQLSAAIANAIAA